MMKKLWCVLSISFLAAAIPACSSTDSGDDGGGGGGDSLPAGLSFYKSGEQASLDYSAAGAEYLIVPYSVSDVAATGIEFTITVAADQSAGSGTGSGTGTGSATTTTTYQGRLERPAPLAVRNPELWARWQRRLAVEKWTRSLAEKAAALPVAALRPLSKPYAACTASAGCAGNEVCVNGQCASSVTINVSQFSTGTITTTVKKKGTAAAVLVDSADSVSQDNIDAIWDKFENLIYKRDSALFGNPALTSGSSQLSSDRNADGLVWLVLTSKVQDKDNAVGFFNATDFTDEAASNKADILYINSSATPSDANAIMAHEFQHLLNYATKVYRSKQNGGNGAIEALWLDEGQAHFAEDACGYGGEDVTLLNQEVLPNFSDNSLFSTTDSMAMRGMAFTYVRYLFEQKGGVTYNSDGTIADKGGAAALAKLHATTKQGTAAVTEVFGDYRTAMDGWIVAMAADGRNLFSSSKYTFGALTTDPKTSNQIGVKIRGTRKDNTGASVTLEGPLEEKISGAAEGSIPNATGKFYLLQNQTGKKTVSVTTSDTNFRFAVLKIK